MVEKYARPDEGIKGICASYMNIGIIHFEQGNNAQALSYYKKSLKIYEDFTKSTDPAKALFGKAGLGRCYNNMGNIALNLFNYTEAIELYNKSLKIKKELNDKRGLSLCYNNIGNVYSETGNYAMAVEPYQNAIQLYEETEDKNGQALVLANVSGLQIMMADSIARTAAERKKYFSEAIRYGKKSYEIALNINAVPIINEAAKNLRVAYRSIGDLKNSIVFSEIYINTKDSMFKEEKTKAITEMEKKYESEKKQQEIEKQILQLSKKDAEIKQQQALSSRQRVIIGFIVCGLLFVIVIMFILYRMFIQKKKTNEIITIKNKDLEQANEEIRAQRDEIESQKNIVVKQKNEIEDIYEELTDSIVYAQRIQHAVLPMNEYLDQFLHDYFILNKPKNIVSGDFFWITKVKNWTLFCVADCTGHGVPGAFMSMLGIALMNEIVRQDDTTQASHVLDQLRKRVIESLNQRGLKGEQQDGMDIAFCALNTENLELHFAGANNPCWIVSQCDNLKMNQFENEKNQEKIQTLDNFQISKFSNLIELNPDKMPIGIHPVMNPFTNQIVQLQKGDTIYLMSDGFEDQFGGPQRKKFYAKNLKNLLIENCQQPMAEQRKMLETTLTDWIGNSEQIDDITILGIKI
jgi:serine phosphatase RsbU (regulator of sigma subunit)